MNCLPIEMTYSLEQLVWQILNWKIQTGVHLKGPLFPEPFPLAYHPGFLILRCLSLVGVDHGGSCDA